MVGGADTSSTDVFACDGGVDEMYWRTACQAVQHRKEGEADEKGARVNKSRANPQR